MNLSFLGKHWSLVLPIAVVAAIGSLVGCDRQTGTTNSVPVSEAVNNQVATTTETTAPSSISKQGPHGGHDPHAALTPEQHIKVALQHRAEGREIEALDTLNRAIVQFNKHAGLLAVRASFMLEKGDLTLALNDLEKAVELDPDDPLIRTNRAQAYRQFGRIAESIADLDHAIKLNPDLVAARFNRGAIRYSSGDHKAALVDFDHCIAVDPHTAAPYFNRAAVHDALGERTAAIADLNRFLELTDNDAWKKSAQELLQKWSEQSVEDQSKS